MIKFFSNHTDASFIKEFTGEDVEIIKHPYIEPEWSMDDIKNNCEREIMDAIIADQLIINGDYSIVSLILIARSNLNKKTGFICMKKLNEPSNEINKDGNIIHRNILKPINIRWTL